MERERERDREVKERVRDSMYCIIYIDNIKIDIHLNKTYICLDLLS